MTLEHLMLTPTMKNAKILAGKEGLSREIVWFAQDSSIQFSHMVIPGLLLIYTLDNHELNPSDHNDYLAGILLFKCTEEQVRNELDLSLYDRMKLPLILMPAAISPSLFTKRILSVLSSAFRNEQYTEEWLREICYSEQFTPNDMIANYLGHISQDYFYRCIIVKMRKAEHLKPTSIEMDIYRARDIIIDCFRTIASEVFAFTDNTSLIIFVPFHVSENPITDSQEKIKTAAQRIREQLQNRKWSFFVGTNAHHLVDFHTSYRDALTVQAIVESLKTREPVCFYENWYMHTIILSQPPEKLEQYMDFTLRPITDDPDLLNTLSDYLTFGENKKITAEHLHLHTNTVKYRLHRIGELLHCDLSDPNVCFRLRMALTIHRYLQNCDKVNNTV